MKNWRVLEKKLNGKILINQFATFLSNKSVLYLFSVIDNSSVKFFVAYHLLRIICLVFQPEIRLESTENLHHLSIFVRRETNKNFIFYLYELFRLFLIAIAITRGIRVGVKDHNYVIFSFIGDLGNDVLQNSFTYKWKYMSSLSIPENPNA